jgi:hypothetical protein
VYITLYFILVQPPSHGSPLTPQFGSVDLALLELPEGEHGGLFENHSLLNDVSSLLTQVLSVLVFFTDLSIKSDRSTQRISIK